MFLLLCVIPCWSSMINIVARLQDATLYRNVISKFELCFQDTYTIRTYDEIVSANANEMQVSGTFQCTYKGRVGIDTF